MRSRWPALIVAIALLILAALVLVGVFFWMRLSTYLPGVIQSELQTRLHRKVQVGAIRLTSLDTAVLTDVKVQERPSFGTGTFFYSPRIVVRFNRSLFRYRAIPTIQSITSVTVYDPYARLIRNKQGTLNISDLLHLPPVPPAAQFRGVVSVRSGEAAFVDYAASVTSPPAINTLTGVGGQLDFRPAHSFVVDITGAGADGHIGAVSIVGTWGLDRPVTNLTVTVSSGNASYWFGYLTRITSWSIGQGTFSAQAHITRPVLTGPFVVRGTCAVRGASITSKYLAIPVKPVNAALRFTNTGLTINSGAGALNGWPINFTGTVNGFSHPTLDLRGSSSRMSMAVLQRAFKVSLPIAVNWGPPGSFNVRAAGPSRDLTVTGTLREASASAYGITLRNISASGVYRSHVIRITSVTARVGSGSVTASSVLRFRPFTATVTGMLNGVNLTAIPYLARLRPTGTASGPFTFTYAPGVERARAQLTLSPGRISGISYSSGRGTVVLTGPGQLSAQFMLTGVPSPTGVAFTTATVQLTVRQGVITVSRATVGTAGGQVSLAGTVSLAGALNLAINVRGISAQSLLGMLGYTGITGTVSFTGRLTGAVSNPRLAGAITARGGEIRGVQYEFFTAQLSASTRQLLLQNLALRSTSGNITATGNVLIIPRGPVRLNLTASAERVDLGAVESLLGVSVPVSGILTANLTIQGTVPNLRVAGQASVTNAIVAGTAIDTASVSLQSTPAGTVINQLVVRRGNEELVGSGTIGPSGALNISLRTTGLNLSLLNGALRPYVVLSGPADISATVTGTLTNPLVQADLTSTGLTINGQPFSSFSTIFVWNGTTALVRDTSLVAATGAYRISQLRYVPKTKFVSLDAAVNNVPIPDILALLHGSPAYGTPRGAALNRIVSDIPQPATGVLNIAANLSMSLSQTTIPTGSATMSVTGLSLASTQYGDVNAALQFSPAAITVQDLSITGPLGTLTAQGYVTASGTIAFTGSGRNISLAVIHPWLPKETASGTADFSFAASGTLEQPVITASLTATNLARGNISVGTVTVGRVTITSDRLIVDNLVVRREGATLTVSGYVPFSLTPLSIPRDEPLSVAVQVTDPTFALAKYFPSLVQEATGSLTATAQITGTLNNPAASGNISLQNGFLHLAHFNNNFMHITLMARFQGSQVVVETLTGESSLGGSFTGGGTMTLGGTGGGMLALFLTLNALRLSETNITATRGEQVTMTTTGRLDLAQSIRNPIIEGQLVVSDATVVLPATTVTTTAPTTVPVLPVTTQLAVTVNLAQNVSVRRGGLSATVTGPITVAGTSTSPSVSGTVQIVNGRVSYVGRTLDLQSGGTVSFLFHPPQPAVVVVDVTAVGTVTLTSTFTGFPTRYRVFVDITGPLGDLTLEVRSSPPGLGDIEALSALFGVTALQALVQGQPAANLFEEQLGQLLLGVVIPGLFQPIELGAFTFTLEPALESSQFYISVSAYISNSIFLTYSQPVAGGIPLQNFSINYTLSPSTAATVEFETQNGNLYDTLYLLQYYKRF